MKKFVQKLKQQLKSISFIYKPYIYVKNYRFNKRQTKKLKENGANLFNEINTVLKNNTDILAFICFGTLLGMVRENNFIAWDNDLDYGILDNDTFTWEKVDKILASIGMRVIREFSLDGKITEKAYEKNGLTVDFFLFYKTDNGIEYYCFYRELGKQYESDKVYEVSSQECPSIKKIELQQFGEYLCPVPTNSEELLSVVYGPSWQIPDPNFVSLTQKVKGKKAFVKYYRY